MTTKLIDQRGDDLVSCSWAWKSIDEEYSETPMTQDESREVALSHSAPDERDRRGLGVLLTQEGRLGYTSEFLSGHVLLLPRILDVMENVTDWQRET